jgi:hypothetical protein
MRGGGADKRCGQEGSAGHRARLRVRSRKADEPDLDSMMLRARDWYGT